MLLQIELADGVEQNVHIGRMTMALILSLQLEVMETSEERKVFFFFF